MRIKMGNTDTNVSVKFNRPIFSIVCQMQKYSYVSDPIHAEGSCGNHKQGACRSLITFGILLVSSFFKKAP